MRFRKVLPTFVLTALLNGELNQMMFLRLVEFVVDGVLKIQNNGNSENKHFNNLAFD